MRVFLSCCLLLLLVGCSTGPPPEEEKETPILGEVTLIDDDLKVTKLVDKDRCQGTGGYSDIREGMKVVVRDGDGKVLATSSFSEGTLENRQICRFLFLVEEVAEADFYEIELGRRGSSIYSKAELAQVEGALHFSIGQ